MKNRCLNPSTPDYALYGAKGVCVCAEWANSFDAFLACVGKRPSSRHSIDRIDPFGNYEPSNVRWADDFQQANNRRQPTKRIEFQGESLTIGEWAERIGVKRDTLKRRLQTMTIEKALTLPNWRAA